MDKDNRSLTSLYESMHKLPDESAEEHYDGPSQEEKDEVNKELQKDLAPKPTVCKFCRQPVVWRKVTITNVYPPMIQNKPFNEDGEKHVCKRPYYDNRPYKSPDTGKKWKWHGDESKGRGDVERHIGTGQDSDR